MNIVAHEEKSSPTINPASSVSSALTFTSDTTAVSQYTPTEYERVTYYNGITADGDHPVLVYRSDFGTTPFSKPVDRFAHAPVKTVRGIYGTSLVPIWDSVGFEIIQLMTIEKIACSSIGAARFFTHPSGGEEKGLLGPVVIWLGVNPGSTSSDTAHEVSQKILSLLGARGVSDVVVEWKESVVQRLGGPPLMKHVGSTNPTHHVRRFLTPLLGIPLATQGMEKDDSQGTLTLWFHENKDKNGNASANVYGVSNCHVLRKNTTIDYERKGGASRDFVRVCGVRRFRRGLDEIKKAISDHGIRASYFTQEIMALEEAENLADVEDEIEQNRRSLVEENNAIHRLEAMHEVITKEWSDITLHRDIGYVQYAKAIEVDVEGGTRYTSDWGAFLATEAKVKPQFEGNVVDIGSKNTPDELMALFYPRGGGATTFKFPPGRKLRIVGCTTKDDLDHPTELDSEGHPCFIVAKDGNTTDLTVGVFAGVVTFTLNDTGVWSKELGIYNSSYKKTEVFSDHGDSGSLVWRTKDGKGYIVGQLHSGENIGGSTRSASPTPTSTAPPGKLEMYWRTFHSVFFCDVLPSTMPPPFFFCECSRFIDSSSFPDCDVIPVLFSTACYLFLGRWFRRVLLLFNRCSCLKRTHTFCLSPRLRRPSLLLVIYLLVVGVGRTLRSVNRSLGPGFVHSSFRPWIRRFAASAAVASRSLTLATSLYYQCLS